ncbi:MAG: capsular biosynthesis protein [Novosphingobium sp.]|nr:capsular biosynthesis protein [Novosphingobium sp.]MCP5402423.1 capsular biosynthesis protein [Novosphingobium sp.]
MTDQSKIPLPSGDDGDDEAKSLIERAVKAFDLGKLAPPPVPDQLPAGKRKPARREPPKPAAENAPEKAAFVPVVEQSVPVTVESQTAHASPDIAPPAPVAEKPPEPVVPPSQFKGPRHPVDRDHLREQGLIVPEGGVTALLEEFRIVKRQLLVQAADLRRQGSGAAAQRVLISSPHPAEGKTYCSVNLALSIAAEKESEVILVDADFAKPSVLSVLGLPGGPGLMDALTDETVDVADFVIGTDIPGLWVLPAGNATNTDTEYLGSSRSSVVLNRLTEGAPQRIVIFDSPPALAASPAAELAKHVGQVLMVVRADQTSQGALDDAISLLSSCPNIQLLLNAAQFSPSGRRFGSYYGYGR